MHGLFRPQNYPSDILPWRRQPILIYSIQFHQLWIKHSIHIYECVRFILFHNTTSLFPTMQLCPLVHPSSPVCASHMLQLCDSTGAPWIYQKRHFLHIGIFSDLSLHRSCARCHNHCEFICEAALLCPERIRFIYTYMYVSVSVRVYVRVSAGAHGGQEDIWSPGNGITGQCEPP